MIIFVIFIIFILNFGELTATLTEYDTSFESDNFKRTTINIMDLPSEIQEHIVLQLYPQDIYQFRCINKQCALLSYSNIFWKNFCTVQGYIETDLIKSETIPFNYRHLFMASHHYEKLRTLRGLTNKETLDILTQAAYSNHIKAQQELGIRLSSMNPSLFIDYSIWRHDLVPSLHDKKYIDDYLGKIVYAFNDLEILFFDGMNLMRATPPDMTGLYWMHRSAFQLGKKYLNKLGMLYGYKLVRNANYADAHMNLKLNERACKQIALSFFNMTSKLGSKKGKKYRLYLKKVFYG